MDMMHLNEALRARGVTLDERALERLQVYHALLLSWNERMDLTNVRPEDMETLHYQDSLLPLARADWFTQNARIIDVGTGAGFPGLMLALARPDLSVTLLDSRQKRCDFLTEAVGQTGVRNVRVLCARAEDAAQDKAFRERFDIVCARAVAPLTVLAELLLPFARVGGCALAWKGPALAGEKPSGARACALLGGKMGETYRLPIDGREHYIQKMDKTKRTVPQYPRKSGTPAKHPLCCDEI